MSDAPALPGAGGDSGVATPGSTRAARSFRPSHERSFRNDGISADEALARLTARRRGEGESPRGGGDRSNGRARPPAPSEIHYSPLTTVLDEPPPDLPTSPPGAAQYPQPTDPTFVVTIHGQPQELPLSELTRGYIRNQDYTQKTQELAEASRSVTAAQQQNAQLRQQLAQIEARLPALLQQLAGEFSAPVDWEKIAREDPIGYAQKDARYKAWLAANAEAQRLAQVRGNEDLARKVEIRRQGHEFLNAVLPGWRDPTTRAALQQLQTEHLRAVGFTPDEIAATELLDPRHVIILEESRRFRAIAAAHPELLRAGAVRPTPPAARREMPQGIGGNGRGFDRAPAAEGSLSEAERRWQELPSRTGRDAREAAVSLIAARRAAGTNGAALRPTRGRF